MGQTLPIFFHILPALARINSYCIKECTLVNSYRSTSNTYGTGLFVFLKIKHQQKTGALGGPILAAVNVM